MKPQIMGILNVTPDSFSDGGRWSDPKEAVLHGKKLVEEGADWIDVGGESTRPGSTPVSVEEELRRVLPVIEQLADEQIQVSVDTQKPEVARAALKAGAQMVNDVSGLRSDRMEEVIAEFHPVVCIMHMQGSPDSMQDKPTYRDVVDEVRAFLIEKARELETMGIPREKIFLDPGIGFGKLPVHNLELIKNLDRFVASGFPILIGVSRKSWLGLIGSGPDRPPLPVTEREEVTLAVQSFAQIAGVSMIRTHNVAGAVRARNALAAILNGSTQEDRP